MIRILANDGYVKIDSVDFPSRDVLHAEATPLAESFLKEGGYTRRAEHQSRHQKEDKRQTEEAKMRYLLIVYSTLSGFLGSAILADNAPVLARCIAGIALLFFLACLLVMASRVDKKNKTSDNSH